MRTQIFFLAGQDALTREVASLLRREIHPDIDVQMWEIVGPGKGRYRADLDKIARQYLRLLRSSLISTDPFEIVVRNDSDTQWGYLGNYSEFGENWLELRQSQLGALFPAVAIMDRVVMLPEKFHQEVDVYPRSFLSMARPLDIGGVELVDFDDPHSLRRGIGRVVSQLRREWRNLCHQQMSIRGLFVPDYFELGRLLAIDPEILRANATPAPGVRLEVAVVEAQAVEGATSRIVLELRNAESRALHDIRVRVRAPIGALKTFESTVTDLVPPNTVRLELELTPKLAPLCPLEVFVDQGVNPADLPSYPIVVLVDVARSPVS